MIYRIFIAFSLFSFSSCAYYHISGESASVINVYEDSAAESEIEALISPYSEKLGMAMDQVIGSTSVELYKAKPESPLGNFLTDIVQQSAEQKTAIKENLFSIVNYGGIRLPALPAGDITSRMIYELLPFENYIDIVEMNSEQLQFFLDHISKRGPWPVSAELSYKISLSDSTAKDILINERALDASALYYVAMPDYIANGGDDCSFLKPLKRSHTGMLLRDVIIEHIQNKKSPLSASIEDRVRYE